MSIPTIDLSRGAAAIADDIRRACEDVGFFTVVGHGVDDALTDEVAERSRAFFDRSEEEKERFRGPASVEGAPIYRPLGAEKLGANADRKASLDWGPTLAGVAWPDDALRMVYERYYREMLRVASTLVSAFGFALDDDLEAYFDDRSSSLRVIDYPAGSGAGPRAGAHRDYGCLTIIRSDASGLEAQTRRGEWVAVEPPPGGLVVNIGDLMAFWTEERWVSTLHRVVGTEGDAPRRQSLVFFHNPRADTLVNGVRAGDYILARAADAGLSTP
jgi:isopenicillin N synthase-like dioxygenase